MSNQSETLLVDEICLRAHLMRNKIADIIQDIFARQMNHLVYEEARKCCEGCELDDPSQLHHDCLMVEEEENWIRYYDLAKEHLNIDKLWTAIEKETLSKLDLYLEYSWFKYLLNLLKVDETSAFLLYKDAQRREYESGDDCLTLGCYDYIFTS
ncbi:hypothetical protein ACROYT_G018797 [Oculina patagonica]